MTLSRSNMIAAFFLLLTPAVLLGQSGWSATDASTAIVDFQHTDDVFTLRKWTFSCDGTAPQIQVLSMENAPVSADSRPVLDLPMGLDHAQPVMAELNQLPKVPWMLIPSSAVGQTSSFQLLVASHYKNGDQVMALKSLQLKISALNLKRGNAPALPGVMQKAAATGKQQLKSAALVQAAKSDFPPLRLDVAQEGIAWITPALLKEGGWSVSKLDPRNIRVTCQGREVPVHIPGEADGRLDKGDGIEFWAESYWTTDANGMPQKPLYADNNVYWIELSDKPGLRLAQESAFGEPRAVWQTRYPRSAPVSVAIEENRSYQRLPYAIDTNMEDHWFYQTGIIGGEKQEISFILINPDGFALQKGSFRIRLRSQTQRAGVHDLDLFINNQYLGTRQWSGNEAIYIEDLVVNPYDLKDGMNTVTVVNKSAEGALATVMVDGFEVIYPRLLETADDIIRFSPPQNSLKQWVRYDVKGFTQPEVSVMRPGVSMLHGMEMLAQTDTLDQVTYQCSFESLALNTGTEYIVYGPEARWEPDSLTAMEIGDWQSEAAAADYVVIVPNDSMGAEVVAPLIAVREAQGFKSVVVPYADLVNLYHDGIPHVLAIRNFLTDLYRINPDLMRYVLLVGDGHWDYRQGAEKGNHLPVPMYPTYKFGAAAADHWYVCLDGDDFIPEYAIGRFPVQTVDELETVIDKLVTYNTQGPDAWRNRYLLIGAGGHGDVFYLQSEELINKVLDKALEPERLYLAGDLTDPYVGGTEDLFRHFRDGVSLLNFRGHGGGAIWADAGLLDLDDIPLLENKGRLPFITSMTCFTGDFSSSRACLGEALLAHTEAGAMGMWGASGVGWVYNDYYLLTELYSEMQQHPEYTLGRLINTAKERYLDIYSGILPYSEVNQYNLIGDPAQRMILPGRLTDMALEHQTVEDGDELKVTFDCEATPATVTFELADRNNNSTPLTTMTVNQSPSTVQLSLPQDLGDGEKGLRLYASNEASDYHAHGYLTFRKGMAYFDSLGIDPPIPVPDQPFVITAAIEGRDGIRRAWCRLMHPVSDSLQMVPGQVAGTYRSRNLGPYPSGQSLVFAVGAEDGLGRISMSDTISMILPYKTDIRTDALRLAADGSFALEAVIRNSGQEAAPAVPVRFSLTGETWTAWDTIAVDPGAESLAQVTYPAWLGQREVVVHADPLNTLGESGTGNNMLIRNIQNIRWMLTPEQGSQSTNQADGWIGHEGVVLLNVAAQAVSQNRVIQISPPRTDIRGARVYEVDWSLDASSAELMIPAELRLYQAGLDTLAGLHLYHREAEREQWTALPYMLEQDHLTAAIQQDGLFKIATTQDIEPPRIDIEVEDQSFTANSYVSRSGTIYVILEDQSGVDMRPGAVKIWLDGQLLPDETVTAADSLESYECVTLALKPSLMSGQHEIRVDASDIHGNRDPGTAIPFRISQGLEIEYLGNHPNPFRRETVFVYNLTDGASQVSIKIYTTDGRLIKVFDEASLAGADYHEVVWDGQDQWGEPVANGVYFFRIKAKGAEKTVEYTGKIAKIR